tara:strand:- start:1531 stop:1749 length:219 start_codon:yes stop_codon:yes gene_type:complete
MTDHKIDYDFEYQKGTFILDVPEQSKWTCYMFGNRPGGMGLSYIPNKGEVPNRFVRFMMRICFDCYWVKEND